MKKIFLAIIFNIIPLFLSFAYADVIFYHTDTGIPIHPGPLQIKPITENIMAFVEDIILIILFSFVCVLIIYFIKKKKLSTKLQESEEVRKSQEKLEREIKTVKKGIIFVIILFVLAKIIHMVYVWTRRIMV